jgi:hypothetical protein
MKESAFDVVTVPDFTGPAARRFEIRTLFFLASWLEHGGRSRNLPLHIACIGEAPESVRLLASSCGAEITSHSPLLFGGLANKLRGFEVRRQTEHMLLLDSDMLVLSEIHDLPGTLGRECVAAAAANGANIVPTKDLKVIYEMLGIPFPDNQVVPVNVELDTFKCVSYRHRKSFPPYYNTGVVYAPWHCGLGEVWRDHLERTSKVAKRAARINDQPSFATAVAFLKLRGFDFRILPDEYHMRLQHLATGSVSSREARLFHAIGFVSRKPDARTVSAEEALDAFHESHLDFTRNVRSHRGPLSETEQRASLAQIGDCHRLHRLIKSLYDKHVRELVQ